MLVDLIVKGFAENGAILVVRGMGWLGSGLVKPKMKVIKKMKASPVEHQLATRFVIGSEKHGGAKDALKTFHKPAISLAIFEETEKVENLGWGPEAHDPAALPNRNSRYPDWNEPVLAVRKSELRMTEHLKEELSIPSRVK
jgi:hypothetical protein